MTQTTRVIRLRPHSGTTSPDASVVKGVYPALDPTFHDLGLGQHIRCHQPTTCSPRSLSASPAVQPVTPSARCPIVHQVQAVAMTPDAIVLRVSTQLRTPCRVLFLERTVAMASGRPVSENRGGSPAAQARGKRV